MQRIGYIFCSVALFRPPSGLCIGFTPFEVGRLYTHVLLSHRRSRRVHRTVLLVLPSAYPDHIHRSTFSLLDIRPCCITRSYCYHSLSFSNNLYLWLDSEPHSFLTYSSLSLSSLLLIPAFLPFDAAIAFTIYVLRGYIYASLAMANDFVEVGEKVWPFSALIRVSTIFKTRDASRDSPYTEACSPEFEIFLDSIILHGPRVTLRLVRTRLVLRGCTRVSLILQMERSGSIYSYGAQPVKAKPI